MNTAAQRIAWASIVLTLLATMLAMPVAAQKNKGSSYYDGGEKKVRLRGDLRLRSERVELPNGAVRERFLPQLRLGLDWILSDWVEVGVSVYASSADEEFGPRFDNEDADGVDIDTAFMLFRTSPNGELLVGQSELPLWLTPMVWDDDLRTAGVSYAHRFEFGLNALRFAAGYFNVRHPFNDQATMAGAQLAYLIGDGAPSGAEFIVSAVIFDELDDFVIDGLARQNRVRNDQLYKDFELVEVQIAGRTQLVSKPLELRLSYVQNFGADDRNEGYRSDLSWGDLTDHGFEISYTAERIQWDAVLGAFNSDDWWLHTWFRGHLLRFEARLFRKLSGEVTAVSERQDNLETNVKRYMVDLNWRF